MGPVVQGAIATAGSAVSWLRDGLALIASVDELEPLARSVDGTAGALGTYDIILSLGCLLLVRSGTCRRFCFACTPGLKRP